MEIAPSTSTRYIKTDLANALMHLQARYALLSSYAERAIKASKAIRKPIPHEFLVLYAMAVTDYKKFGRELFNIIQNKGLSIEQVVFRHGQPERSKIDPDKFRTVRIDAPMVPPSFTMSSSVGAIPLVIAGIIIGELVITSLLGYLTLNGLRKMQIWLGEPDYNPDKKADVVLRAFEALETFEASAP